MEPTDLEDREKVARQIWEGRVKDRQEKKINWNNFRHGANYLAELEGLSDATDYIRKKLTSKIILDIGAGSTIGTMHLQQCDFSHGLEYWATSLTRPDISRGPKGIPKDVKLIPDNRLVLTSAEQLRGFKNNSVAMILAVHSISYSESVDMVMKRMDEILVPGGLIKALYRNPKDKREERQSENTHQLTVKLLEKYGYPYEVKQIYDGFTPVSTLISAIKPTASNIYEKDKELLLVATHEDTYEDDIWDLPLV